MPRGVRSVCTRVPAASMAPAGARAEVLLVFFPFEGGLRGIDLFRAPDAQRLASQLTEAESKLGDSVRNAR